MPNRETIEWAHGFVRFANATDERYGRAVDQK